MKVTIDPEELKAHFFHTHTCDDVPLYILRKIFLSIDEYVNSIEESEVTSSDDIQRNS